MRILKALLGAATTSMIISCGAFASDNAALCKVYSSIGGSTAEFILPITVQELVGIRAGTELDLINLMSISVMSDVTGADLMVMRKIGEAEADLLGEAAAQVAIETLVSGQANTKLEIQSLMNTSCNKIGAKNIIANQMKVRAATDANMRH